MDEQSTAEDLARRMVEGFNNADYEAIAACLHAEARADFPFAPPGMPASFEGRDGVLAGFSEGRASLAEMKLSIAETYWCPGKSALFFEATSKGRLVTGADYANRYIFMIAIRDGRVALWREYFDSAIIMRALAG